MTMVKDSTLKTLRTLSCRCCTATRMKSTLYKANTIWAEAAQLCSAVRKRYQLIGSKRYDNAGKFGFTLIRQHPLSKEEEKTKKSTWYEYLKVDEDIPAFDVVQQDLGLCNRKFTTGTIIKLYSYDLPAGSRSVISRDLNQSINEYLFEPVLPVITVDKKERYPDDRNLERDLYGLKRRLEQDDNKYVDKKSSDDFNNALFGKMKVTCYVFRTKIDDRSVKKLRKQFVGNFSKITCLYCFRSMDRYMGTIHLNL